MDSKVLQREVNKLLTVRDLRKMFRVSAQTVHAWRDKKNLPTVVIPSDRRPAIRFVETEIRSWAKQHDMEIYQ